MTTDYNGIHFSDSFAFKIPPKKIRLHLKPILHSFVLLTALFNCQAVHASNRAQSHETVCLNMIVKNEIDVIRRCLTSCRPLIDYWVIVDTGSTDDTQDAIREFMRDVPGELHERPWKNFAHNRNEALELARGKSDYILIIDADDVFKYEPGFKFLNLDKDFYHMDVMYGSTHYMRVHLFRSKLIIQWKGVVHESLNPPPKATSSTLSDIYYFCCNDGDRSQDPKKFEKDAQLLEEILLEEPENNRYIFYLAQSYKAISDYKKALETYQRRVDSKGWDEEVFWSLLQIANIQREIKETPEKIERSYWRAFQFRPTRAEPLYYLSQHYRDNKNYEACYSITKLGMGILFPSDVLFVEKSVYDWGIILENSVGAWWLGKYQESSDLSNQLLNRPDLPSGIRETVERNLKFAHDKIVEGAE